MRQTSTMESKFGRQWASAVVGQLRDCGIEFAAGLTPAEIAQIGDVFGVAVPEELAQFLEAGGIRASASGPTTMLPPSSRR